MDEDAQDAGSIGYMRKGSVTRSGTAGDRPVATYDDPLCPHGIRLRALRDNVRAGDGRSVMLRLDPASPLPKRFRVVTHQEEILSMDRQCLKRAINRVLGLQLPRIVRRARIR